MNLTKTPSIKYDKSNFLPWQYMIMPIIKCYNLESYLLGTKECPSKFLSVQTTSEGEEAIKVSQNPEYIRWMSIDQLLMGWLYSSMTPEIAMRVMGSTSLSKL